MTKHTLPTRPGMTAIAAFAALSSTPLMAQDADPLAPASDVAPAVTSTPPIEAVSEPTAAPVADPLAPTTATAAITPVARTARTAIGRSATRSPTPGNRPAARTVVPVAAAAAVTVAQDTSVGAPVAAVPPPMAVPEPISADAATATVAPPVASSSLPDEALPIAGGLGALALAAAAIALRRRRRVAAEHAQVRYDEPAFAAPVGAEPAFVEPVSARAERPIMAWGAPAAAATATATAAAPAGDGMVPSGVDSRSHAAAAYRGSSADNPSLSLKKRLKRAAFFDQREKLAAAGLATPIAADAGLPDRMAAPAVPRAAPVAASAKPALPLTSGGAFRPSFQTT